MNHHVVVWDPEDKYWEGSLVDHSVAVQIRQRGGVALPVDPSLFQVAGTGGFFKRAWGAGWVCDFQTPRHFCPLTLYLLKDYKILHWAARLVPTERNVECTSAPDDSGMITLMSMPARGNSMQASLTSRTAAKRIRDLGPCDSNRGWTIDGNAFANVSGEGQHAFSLYGTGSGIRVAWAAITSVKG